MIGRFIVSQTTLVIAAIALCGCQTVHTADDEGVPVAIWASTVLLPLQGDPAPAETHEKVSRVLLDHGLHPTLDANGISVPEAEETGAREALLTDRRLAGSGVEVVLIIPAGTGRKMSSGFAVPVVAPREPVRLPPTTGPTTTESTTSPSE
jgi:hypothetical protein